MSQKAGDPVLANKDFLPVYAYGARILTLISL